MNNFEIDENIIKLVNECEKELTDIFSEIDKLEFNNSLKVINLIQHSYFIY